MALPIERLNFPTASASAFGRIFYGIGNRVLFSSVVIDDFDDLGKCYQSNDPTSHEISDILATDGGNILIQDAGNVLSLSEFYRGVLAFCDNGIWYITGPESGFSAEAYEVFKITEDTMISPYAKVVVGDRLFIASHEGIISLVVNEFGAIKPENITEQTINTYYQDFATNQLHMEYDPLTKQVWYIEPVTNRALIHDLRADAFYPQQFQLDEDTHVAEVVRVANEEDLKFFYDDTITPAIDMLELKDETFEDLGNVYESYIITSEESLGKFSHSKSAPSIFISFRKTEQNVIGYDSYYGYEYDYPSGCNFSVQFDFTDNDSNEYNTYERQIYRPNIRGVAIDTNALPAPFDNGRSVVEYKDMIRGAGNSLRFKFRSEPNKDMQILGYSVEYSMRGRQ